LSSLLTNRIATRNKRGFNRSDELTYKKQSLDDLTIKDLKDIRAVVGNDIQDSQAYASTLKSLAAEADCSLNLYLKVVQMMKEGVLLEPREMPLLQQTIPSVIQGPNPVNPGDTGNPAIPVTRSPEYLKKLEDFFERHPHIKQSGKLNKVSCWNMFTKEYINKMSCIEVRELLSGDYNFSLTSEMSLITETSSTADRFKACGVKWRRTSDSEKQVFVDKAAEYNKKDREGNISKQCAQSKPLTDTNDRTRSDS